MRIYDCKTNHIKNPLGYEIAYPTFSWKVGDTTSIHQKYVIIRIAMDETMQDIVYDSGNIENIFGCAFEVPMVCEACTRYYWTVTVAGDTERATSEIQWFETGKKAMDWKADWITPKQELASHPVMAKRIEIKKKVVKARAYVCGLGLYEMRIGNQKVGEEYFTPHYTAYDKWQQYQTYDVLDYLKSGMNMIQITLGNGWYKGDYGLDGRRCIYGDKFALLFEMQLDYADGTNEIIVSDESWSAESGNITESGIYYGEDVDDTLEYQKVPVVKLMEGYEKLQAMRSLPVKIKEERNPEIISCADGSYILDFKQNMVGFIRCIIEEPRGTQICIQFGEVLQNGCFYRDNYRSARSEFRYISDGRRQVIEPKFTFYGFRYAKVTGVTKLEAKNFTGCVLYSDIQECGSIISSHEKLNQLIQNTKWSLKGNSLDLPTDCPQRNERMGWTGDCQAICSTAMFFYDMYAFYEKWLYELQYAQYENGCVPDVVPRADYGGKGACAWSDAATIVPYQLYLVSGDSSILHQQYDSMKAWVDYITREETDTYGLRRGDVSYHYGDWLALDHPQGRIDPNFAEGYTDKAYLSSVYYLYSSQNVANTAKVIGKEEDYRKYTQLTEKIREAIYSHMLSRQIPEMQTQTALILALAFHLMPKEEELQYVKRLKERFQQDDNKLLTGFIGTIFALQVLCENGMKDLAYQLLLTETYPGWLYAVNLGATTIWERWDSLLPDGSVNKGGMNSFNHYAYGMVVGWIVQYSAGIKVMPGTVGYKKVEIKPYPDKRLSRVAVELDSPMGKYRVSYEYQEFSINYEIEIPFACEAKVILQQAKMEQLMLKQGQAYDMTQDGDDVVIHVMSGKYIFELSLL